MYIISTEGNNKVKKKSKNWGPMTLKAETTLIGCLIFIYSHVKSILSIFNFFM